MPASGAPSGEPLRPWWRGWTRDQKLAALIGLATVAVAVVGVLVAVLFGSLTLARTPPETLASAGSVDSVQPSIPVAPAPRPEGDCVSLDGQPVACRVPGAHLRVQGLEDCSSAGVLRVLGITTERRFDLVAQQAGDVCLVGPGPGAGSAGATAEDLQRIADGDNVAALLACLGTRDSGSADVACSQAHWGELVADPILAREDQVEGQCVTLAREYTQRAVQSGDEPLLASPLLLSDGSFQCVVHLRNDAALYGSVWHIGGSPLPTRPA